MAILSVEELIIHYNSPKGFVQAVEGVSFDLDRGDNLGLVGESGCGKSTIAKSILKILPSNGQIRSGHIYYDGKDIVSMGNNEIKDIRWKEISIISQSAMNALNPVLTIEKQMMDIYVQRWGLTKSESLNKTIDLFQMVGLNKKRLSDYPHQFSGGMRQRVVIAMALALNPSIIIADEPTTALDVIIQDQVLKNIYELQQKLNKSMILITHDISIVAENCNKIAVMYGGKIMEYGDLKVIFRFPFHPYTVGLRNAFPSLIEEKRELISIPGYPPRLIAPPRGCRFFERCPFSSNRCKEEEPKMREIENGHFVACHEVKRSEEIRKKGIKKETWTKVGIRKNRDN